MINPSFCPLRNNNENRLSGCPRPCSCEVCEEKYVDNNVR